MCICICLVITFGVGEDEGSSRQKGSLPGRFPKAIEGKETVLYTVKGGGKLSLVASGDSTVPGGREGEGECAFYPLGEGGRKSAVQVLGWPLRRRGERRGKVMWEVGDLSVERLRSGGGLKRKRDFAYMRKKGGAQHLADPESMEKKRESEGREKNQRSLN